MKSNNLKKFFKCELKFFLGILLGLVILNAIAYILKSIFEQSLLISWFISIVVIVLITIYFIYQLIKVMFNYDYECKKTSERIASWLSSIIGV